MTDKMTLPETTSTRLIHKQYSPLIIRKYQMDGWPVFIALICDLNLDDLDEVVWKLHKEAKEQGIWKESIQGLRNFFGWMNDKITEHYESQKTGSVEAVAVVAYCDKIWISSLYGDFQNKKDSSIIFVMLI